MSQSAIRIDKLGKRYRIRPWRGIYSYKSLRDSLASVLGAPIRAVHSKSNGRRTASRLDSDHIWALKDVSFEIGKGQVIGIIGHNGAGKTTLLKILSRVTHPTEGRAEIRGRVGSLLEVGTGFHPELSGRENIYFNASMLGMKKGETKRRFDEIVSFAGVEKFIDTPVKHYSSGMYVRLAFAVAAHLETEILLVDEVLAVGDVAFQRKCLGKMGDVAHSGRTVLFVSHSLNVVAQLCEEALVLQEGRLALKAPVDRAIAAYLREASVEGGLKRWSAEGPPAGNGAFRPVALAIRDRQWNRTDQIASSEPFWVEIEYELAEAIPDLRVGIILSGGEGILLFAAFDSDDSARYIERRPSGRYRSLCRIPGHLLNEGRFTLGVNAGVFNVGRLFQEEHALTFNVTKTGGAGSHWGEASGGLLRPHLEWKIECLEEFGG